MILLVDGKYGKSSYSYIDSLLDLAYYVTLLKNHEYCYVIKTGSYPQIIHKQNHTTLDGSLITCTEFEDANGKKYCNWIPAIRLE